MKSALGRRKHLVAKYMIITRCLSIILDTRLLNHAVFGEAFVRLVTNYFIHQPNPDSPLVEDLLGRVQELIDKYRSSKDEDRQEMKAREAQVNAELGLVEDIEWENTENGAGASEGPRRNTYLHDAEVINDARRLTNLLHSDRLGYFEKIDEMNSHDTSVEKSIDNFLKEKQTNVPGKGSQVTDNEILLIWLNSFIRCE